MVVRRRRFEPSNNSNEHYDSYTGSCSIEFYNACKDEYRVAPSNKIPVPWPNITKRPSDAGIQIFEDLEDRIRKVLSDARITTRDISFHGLAARATPEKTKDTIVIRTRDDPNLSWKVAASNIYKMVEKAATLARIEMRVEIQNPEKMYADVSQIIRDEVALKALTKIQPFVKKAVMDCCPGKWTSIAYHSRRSKFWISDQKPTIIVFIALGSTHPWLQFEEKIFSVIQSARLLDEVEIALEILPGRIMPAQSQSMGIERPLSFLYLDNLPVVPSNGAPIAPSLSSKEVGSLGAVVYYYPGDNSQKVKCFLTCYNVVASGDPAGREVNDKIGIGLDGRDVDRRIDIDYPAKYDANETKRFLTYRIEINGDETREDAAILKRLEGITAGGPIGHVKYASGHRLNTANRRRMDWALVALKSPSPGDSMQNKPPLEGKFDRDFFQGVVPRYEVQLGDTISGTKDIVENTWYGKLGRTTHGTAAEYARIKRTIAWDDGSVSDEYEFRASDSYLPFAKGGDYGSLVYNMQKEWVGMLFANDATDDAGFVTPVQDLIEDIKQRTGGTIALV